MSIVSSTLVYDIAEPDGSRLLHEQYTDHTGRHFVRYRKASSGEDVAASMTAYAAVLEVQLADSEADEVLQ